jgi:hypothetical protein
VLLKRLLKLNSEARQKTDLSYCLLDCSAL